MKEPYVFLIPDSRFLIAFFYGFIGYLVMFIFLRYFIIRSVIRFNNPLLKFIPNHILENDQIIKELTKYSKTARFILCHSFSTLIFWIILYINYIAQHWIIIKYTKYKFFRYLIMSWHLQADKIFYLKDKIPELLSYQIQCANETNILYVEFSKLLIKLPKNLIQNHEVPKFFTWDLYLFIFIIVIIFFVAQRYFNKNNLKLFPYALVLPAISGLPRHFCTKNYISFCCFNFCFIFYNQVVKVRFRLANLYTKKIN